VSKFWGFFAISHFFSLVFYALFYYLVLALQTTIAQTDLPTSLQPMSVIAKHSTLMPLYNDNNRMVVLLTSDDQQTGTYIGSATWKNVAMGSNSVHNSALDFPKFTGSLLTRNSTNCTTTAATALRNIAELPFNTDIAIGGKNYTIAYDITGNGNRLNSTAAQTGVATLLVNITSLNNGNLTIDLPRKVIDSKTQGHNDTHYVVSEGGRSNIRCIEIKNTQQSRILAIDFVKGIVQIAITGTGIFPSNDTAPIAIVAKAPLVVNESSLVILNGSGSYDPDREPITFTWRQTSGPDVGLKVSNASIATFTAPKVSNDTKMSFNLGVKDKADLANNATETVLVRHIARPPLTPTPTGVNATAAFHTIVDSGVPYYFLAIIATAMVIPLGIDMILAYRKKSRENSTSVVGMPGLYRTLMTFGVILLVGTILFYILILITVNINSINPTLQSLIDVFKNLATILGTALASIIAFYFGMKGSEIASDKAAQAATASLAKTTAGDKTPPTVLDTSPHDGSRDIPVDSLVTASFNKRIDTSTINVDTFTVKEDGTTINIAGTVHLSPDGKTAIFRANQVFSTNTKYVATIDIAIKDEAGNRWASTKEWSFITINHQQ
jgi:Bacterial Ig-like domain